MCVVHKLVVNNEEFVEVLILFCNLVIQKEIVLKRWRSVLDAMLEKGKGPLLGKLRVIDLIEGDLLILVRMHAGLRYENNAKKDRRLSHFNFGSRKHCSIESASLKKSLICDTSKYYDEPRKHLISDLEACYDRQIPAIGGIVEEALGAHRKVMQLKTKTVSTFKLFVCAGFSISGESHGGKYEQLVGTRQGNIVSRAICRD